MGRRRLRTLSYADDVTLLAENEKVLRDMLKRLKIWIKRKGLELNAKKTKIMIFRKAGGRRKNCIFEWNGENLEIVKKFDYLGYTLKGNNKEGEHINSRVGKANGVVGRLWSIVERKFKSGWNLRMRLFDAMMKGILLYGAEQWGWKEWKEIERIQMKYIRWTMKLNKNTPWHTIRKDASRRKIAGDALKRALKFEEKISKRGEEELERISWNQACRDEEEEWRKGERTGKDNGKREALEKAGWSVMAWNESLRRGENRAEEIVERTKLLETEDTEHEIEKSKYANDLKEIQGEERRTYTREEMKRSRNGLEVVGRFRMGNEKRANEYWRKEEDKLCRVCRRGPETMQHVLEECEVAGTRNMDWKIQVSGDKRSISRLNGIRWKRKRLQVEVERNTEAPRVLDGVSART